VIVVLALVADGSHRYGPAVFNLEKAERTRPGRTARFSSLKRASSLDARRQLKGKSFSIVMAFSIA
jgi:hypothetical protein